MDPLYSFLSILNLKFKKLFISVFNIMFEIKLQLKNFKCFTDATVDLKPFTLLDGKSGAGKTAILKALLFVFMGKEKHCVKFGAKSCLVTASFSLENTSYKATRSIRPNRLKLTTDDGSCLKETEDAEAQDVLNKCLRADILVNGYVGQTGSLSFLTMSPGERFNFLKNILVDHDALTKLKENLKIQKTKRQKRFDVLTGKLDAFECVQAMTKGSDEPIQELERDIKNFKKLISEAEYGNNLRQSIVAKLQQFTTRTMPDIKQEYEAIVSIAPFIDAWSACGRPNLDLLETVPLASLLLRRQTLTNRLEKLTSVMKTTGIPGTCPNCNTSLVVQRGKFLPRQTDIFGPEKLTDVKQAIALETELSALNDELDDVVDVVIPPTEIFTLYEKIPDGGLDSKLLSLTSAQITEKKINLQKEMQQRAERTQLESITLPEFCDVAQYVEKLKDLEDRLSAAKDGHSLKINLLRRGTAIDRRLTADAVARSSTLLSLVSEAETIYMNANICIINNLLNQLLSAMTEDRLNVNLNLESKLGVQKLKISINNAGDETDHTTLSGGETARLNIALAVVLAVIHGIPFIILDEATSSLDQETANLVISIINDAYRGMILCVAHQAVTGIFDHVINVDAMR